jgi:uroporphyrinogen-III synthase
MRVLVTRPMEDCARTAAALESRGHAALIAPLFDVLAVAADMGGVFDAVIATSANAVRMADASGVLRLAALPLFAVGEATAHAARAAGFRNVTAAAGDSRELARSLRAGMPEGSRILQLAGRPRRDEVLAALAGQFHLTTVETYETIARDVLPDDARKALTRRELDAVLHFSPRATRVFGDLAAKAGLLVAAQALTHVFISSAAADPRFPKGRIARRPSLESILDAL